VILFQLSGHGLIDMMSYEKYLHGGLTNYEVPQDLIDDSIAKIQSLQP
jgi:tryptophan synthase beta chain